jgi:hypothetical protein
MLMAVLLRWRALPVVGVLLYAVIVAYGSLLQSPAIAPSLLDASRHLSASGALATALLDGRAVRSVSWAAEGVPFGDWYLLRDHRVSSPDVSAGPDLWPWLTGAKETIPLDDLGVTTTTQIVANLDEHAAPGEAVLVIDQAYRLALVAFEGEVLYRADGENQPDAP